MSRCKKGLILAAMILFCLGGAMVAIGDDAGERLLERFKISQPLESMIPKGVTVNQGFEPGPGDAVGRVQKLSGKVYVIHKDQHVAYRLKRDVSLYEGDTLVTLKRSRLNAIMNDRSLFAMAPMAKLVVDKSYYNEEKKERSSIMGLLFGQVRFLVRKLGAKPNFEVKTPTAVCGVRGSDFAVVVGQEEEQTQSALDRVLDWFNPVPKAHAIVPVVMSTTVLTGPLTSVSFAGVVGTTQVIGPYTVSFAAAGSAASAGVTVTVTAASGVLSAVGPGLASLEMPPGFE